MRPQCQYGRLRRGTQLPFFQTAGLIGLGQLVLGQADILQHRTAGDADIAAQAAFQTAVHMFLAAALVQGEFRVAAQHAGAQARGTDQHAGAAVDAGAVAFHGRHGAGLHHEDARGPLGDAAVQAVDALAAQRAAASLRVGFSAWQEAQSLALPNRS